MCQFAGAALTPVLVATLSYAPYHAVFVRRLVTTLFLQVSLADVANRKGKWLEGYSYGGVIPLCVAAVTAFLSIVCVVRIAKLIRRMIPEHETKLDPYCCCCLCF